MVLVGHELVLYDVVSGLTMDVAGADAFPPLPRGRGEGGTSDVTHAVGAPVHYARVVRVGLTGAVERVRARELRQEVFDL